MLHLFQPTFKPDDNLICCKAGLMWVIKPATSLYSTPVLAMLRDKLRVFLLPLFFPYLKVMLHGTIRHDDFSATQRCNVGTVLQPFETMSQ